jgi:hypothetical protein
MVTEDLKALKIGTWIHLKKIPAQTTKQELASFLRAHDILVDESCISIKSLDKARCASAVVSIPREAIIHLVNLEIDGDLLKGFPITSDVYHKPSAA